MTSFRGLTIYPKHNPFSSRFIEIFFFLRFLSHDQYDTRILTKIHDKSKTILVFQSFFVVVVFVFHFMTPLIVSILRYCTLIVASVSVIPPSHFNFRNNSFLVLILLQFSLGALLIQPCIPMHFPRSQCFRVLFLLHYYVVYCCPISVTTLLQPAITIIGPAMAWT